MKDRSAAAILRSLLMTAVAALALLLSACPPPMDESVSTAVTDDIAPTITVESPLEGSSYGGTITFKGAISDDALAAGDAKGTLAAVSFKISNNDSLNGKITLDSKGAASIDSSFGSGKIEWDNAAKSFSFDVVTTGLKGTITVTLYATDAKSNSSSQTVQLMESAGPSIELTVTTPVDGQPAATTKYKQGTTDLTLTGTVRNSSTESASTNIVKVAWGVTGKDWGTSITVDPATAANTKTYDAPDGSDPFTYAPASGAFTTKFTVPYGAGSLLPLYVSATDANGHTNMTTVYLYEDTAGPEVTLPKPSNGTRYYSKVPAAFGRVPAILPGKIADYSSVKAITYKVSNVSNATSSATITAYSGGGGFFTDASGSFSITLNDATVLSQWQGGGNIKVTFTAVNTDDVSTIIPVYFYEDSDGPTVSPLTMVSNNTVNNKYANSSHTETLSYAIADSPAGLPTGYIPSVSVTGGSNVTVLAGSTTFNNSTTGNVAFSLVAEDNVGNRTTVTEANLTGGDVRIDNAAPTVALSGTEDAAATDAIVRGNQVVTVTATFNETVAAPTLAWSGTASGSQAMNGSGATWTANWTVPTGSAFDGSVNFSVTTTDLADNPNQAATGTKTYTVDNTPPGTPATPSSSTGVTYINAAQRTAGFTVTVSGLDAAGAVSGDTLSLKLGGSQILARTLSAADVSSGSYAFPVAAGTSLGTDGSKTFTASIIDVAGNPGATSGGLGLTLDTTAPTAPTVGGSTGTSFINIAQRIAGISISVSALSGTGAAAGDSLTLKMNGATIGSTASLSTGDISGGVSFPVDTATIGAADASAKAFTAYVTDAAGNPGANGTLTLTTDLSAPTAPTVNGNTGTSYINIAQRTAGISITVAGLGSTGAAAGDTLTLKMDGTTIGSDAALSAAEITSGESFPVTTAQIGTTTGVDKVFTAYVTDAAGNPGTNGTLTLTTDLSAPTAPDAPTSSTGTVHINKADRTGTITFTVGGLSSTQEAENGTLTLYRDDTSTVLATHAPLTAAEILAVSYGFEIASGTSLGSESSTKKFYARLTDAAGNPGTASGALTLNFDVTPPTAPTVGGNTGTSYINIAQQAAGISITVAGLGSTGAVAGDTLTLKMNGTEVGSDAALSAAEITSGESFPITDTQIGTTDASAKVFTAYVTDAVGNPGANGTLTLTTDLTAPTAPTVSGNTGTSYINIAQRTAGISITVAGLGSTGAVAGDTLTLKMDGTTIGSDAALSAAEITSGESFPVTTAQIGAADASAKAFTAYVTDAAGNPGTDGSLTLTTDLTAPAITAASFSGTDSPISLTFNDKIYGDAGLSAGLTQATNPVTVAITSPTDTGITASSITITHTKNTNTALLAITWTDSLSAGYIVKVALDSGTTIYDKAGNSTGSSSASATRALHAGDLFAAGAKTATTAIRGAGLLIQSVFTGAPVASPAPVAAHGGIKTVNGAQAAPAARTQFHAPITGVAGGQAGSGAPTGGASATPSARPTEPTPSSVASEPPYNDTVASAGTAVASTTGTGGTAANGAAVTATADGSSTPADGATVGTLTVGQPAQPERTPWWTIAIWVLAGAIVVAGAVWLVVRLVKDRRR
jgi:hypothetical protein